MDEVRFEVDGESVAGRLHEPQGQARGQIVFAHGLLSQAAEFADAPARLAERGWRAFAVDQRGFGASGGPRGVIDEARATADVLGAVARLRKDRPDLPVGVVGHSMGAVFALGALAGDATIRAGVIAAPMRTVRAELSSLEFAQYRLARGVSRLKEAAGLGPLLVPYKNRYKHLFLDREAARRAEQAGFLSSTVSLANYDRLLAMDGTRLARQVRQPVLTILAEKDRAVKRASSMAVHEALAGPKDLATLACGHSLFGDCEAAKAVDLVDGWMGRHLPSPR
ncbi:MAG TPA: alpha/beta fold hydrolase [Candidatus Thermoplasmatota archaeon]|nr:alpha/beta fold hydrolase [Candidatus Thermoplasmatota archaeon]